jgi:hypothetical protein
MKRTFFLLLSFLAALVLALPPSDAVNDDNLGRSQTNKLAVALLMTNSKLFQPAAGRSRGPRSPQRFLREY